MYEKLFDQSERLFKPFSEIWALQAQAAETLAKTHASVMTEAWNQGVLALQNIPAQKSVEDVFKLQQSYWETMQENLQEMFDNTQGVIMDTNRKISAVLQQSTDTAGSSAVKAIKSAPPIKAAVESAKKAAPQAKKSPPPAKTSVHPQKNTAKPSSTLPVKAATSANGAKAPEPTRPATKTEAKTEAKSDGKAETTKSATTEASAKKSDLLV